jgi:hypothetical protein
MIENRKELLKQFWNEFKFIIGIFLGIFISNIVFTISLIITYLATQGGCLK